MSFDSVNFTYKYNSLIVNGIKGKIRQADISFGNGASITVISEESLYDAELFYLYSL